MNELNKVVVIDKAFNNAWTTLVQNSSQKAIPIIFESQTMRLYFIEIYKQLYNKSGGDKNFMIHWFNIENKYLNCIPFDACTTEKGLLSVLKYFQSNQ